MSADIGRGESPNVGTRTIVLIVAGILVALVIIGIGFQPIFHDRIGQTSAMRHPFPAPVVTPNERAERLALEARQRKDLAGGHGRMPIGAAMKAIAAKGTHAFDPIGGEP